MLCLLVIAEIALNLAALLSRQRSNLYGIDLLKRILTLILINMGSAAGSCKKGKETNWKKTSWKVAVRNGYGVN